jgi:type I restriction enzyme, R subunit
MPPPAIGQSERAIQNRVIALFRDEPGYAFLGDWSDRTNSNVEESLLTANLKRRGFDKTYVALADDGMTVTGSLPSGACR